MNEWTLQLDDTQLSTILTALGELPAKQSFHLLLAIDKQIGAQRQAKSLDIGRPTPSPQDAQG